MSHAGTFESEERLSKPLAGSITAHVLAAAALLASGIFRHHGPDLGDPHAGGVGVGLVTRIPLVPREGRINRLAHDTESALPQEAPDLSKLRRVEAPPPDAVELADHHKKPKPNKLELAQDNYRPKDLIPLNQLRSHTAQAAVSPTFAKAGAGQLAVGPNTPLGSEFGWYAQRVRDIVASRWNTADVTARPNAKAIITFIIDRNGTLRNIELAEPSGSYTLDTSSKRAVLDANPLPPLPAGFRKNQAEMEIWFQLRR